MTFVASAVLVGVVTLLIFASVAKAARPAAVRRTVEEVGVPARAAGAIAWAGIVIEWLVASALALWPSSWYASGGVGALFVVFAGMGVHALVSGTELDCACFGGLRNTRLGWPQVLQLPPLVVCLLLIENSVAHQSLQSGMLVLVGAHAVAATVFVAAVVPSWRRVRDQRVSIAASGRFVEFAG